MVADSGDYASHQRGAVVYFRLRAAIDAADPLVEQYGDEMIAQVHHVATCACGAHHVRGRTCLSTLILLS